MTTNSFRNDYNSDSTNQNILMAKCFSDIAYVLKVHVGNKKASFYSSLVSFSYYFGLTGVAQFLHTNFLSPSTTEHDWILVKLYGKKIGLTD